MNTTLVLASLLLAASPVVAHAGDVASAGTNHAFFRAEVGRSNVDAEASDLGRGSDDDTSWSVRGGYYFHPNFGVEAFYSDVYDKSMDGASAQLSALGVGLVAKRNFGADGHGFFIGARAGVARGEVEVSVDGFGRGSASDTKPYFGVGLGYDFNEQYGLSLDYDRLKGSGDGLSITADTVMLGWEMRF